MAARQKALKEGVVRYNEASSSFECMVCRSPLTGEASVDQHLDGSRHREAGVRNAIDNINSCPDSLKSLLTANCITAAKNGVICITDSHALKCTVCNVALTGIRQIEDHLIGEDHRKKCERQKLSSAPLPAVTPERMQGVQLPVGATAYLGQLHRQHELRAVPVARSLQSARVVEPVPYVSQPPRYAPPGAEIDATYGAYAPATASGGFAPREAAYAPGAAVYAPGAEVYARGADPYARVADPYARGADPYARGADPYARGADPYARGADAYAPGAAVYAPGAAVYAPGAEVYARGADPYARGADAYGPGAEQYGSCYPAVAAPTGRDTSVVSPQANRFGASYPDSPSLAAPPSTIQPKAEQEENMRMIEKAFADGLVIETDNVSERYNCTICSKKFNSPATLYDHLRSGKHKKKEQEKLQRSMSSSSASDVSCILSLDESSSVRGRDPYSVTSEPRGHVYVFNNKFLGQGSNWQRNGAEIDSQNLRETFSKMGYKVFLYEDLTLDQTEQALKEIKQNPELNGIDAFILFILSHGKDPYTFYTNDKNEQNLFYVRSLFTNRNCPHLRGKPKIIFTNYCRGDQLERQDVDAVRDVPTDMITLHAVSEGIMAKRHQRRGTYFVICLCNVLKRFARQLELQDLYAKLYDEMATEGGTKPMIEIHGFVKKFYFNPYQ